VTTVWLSRRVCSVVAENLAENEPETLILPRCRSERVEEPTSGSPSGRAVDLELDVGDRRDRAVDHHLALHRGQTLVVEAAVGEVRVSAAERAAQPGHVEADGGMPVAGIVTSALAGFTSVNSS
jgi:hypothetical protein